MKYWVLRGAVLAVITVAARTMLGLAVSEWPLQAPLLRALAILGIVATTAVWGAVDGRRDARASSRGSRASDLTIRWLAAAAATAVLSGAGTWIVGQVTDISVGRNPLGFELTSGAAFVLLLVFLPAMSAATLGRRFGPKQRSSSVEHDETEAFPVVHEEPSDLRHTQ